VPIQNCRVTFLRRGHLIFDTQLCAWDQGRDACQGDSGAPLIVYQGGRAVAAGLVSFGADCADEVYPGVYTRLGHYEDWIFKVTKRGTCDDTKHSRYRLNSSSSSATPGPDDAAAAAAVVSPLLFSGAVTLIVVAYELLAR